MDSNEIITSVIQFTQESPGNYISEEIAILPEYTGMKIFDTPIFAFGSTDDDLYQRYLSPDVIGNHFLPPQEWLPGAKTVISCFLPRIICFVRQSRDTSSGSNQAFHMKVHIE